MLRYTDLSFQSEIYSFDRIISELSTLQEIRNVFLLNLLQVKKGKKYSSKNNKFF